LKDPTLADLIDEGELKQLQAEYGPGERRSILRQVTAKFFDEWWRLLVLKGNRRGEVVLALRRPDGRILLHTKQFYPEGVFRLPSGGVHPGEPALQAAVREAMEETGLEVTVERLLGLLEYQFQHAGRTLPFVSYVFLVRAGAGRPAVQDPHERITAFRFVEAPELRGVADRLRALPESWSDWGHFRAPAHDLAAEALRGQDVGLHETARKTIRGETAPTQGESPASRRR
jgi:8-oxo-dGTP pyrophosphatase MutT (NUDIX family)